MRLLCKIRLFSTQQGKGKITVDSGAGESVCPTNLLPQEPLKHTTKVGTIYRAAGGQALTNKGEKKITFQSGEVLGSMSFQAIDSLQKPLVSAARIREKGNQIVSTILKVKVTYRTIPLERKLHYRKKTAFT